MGKIKKEKIARIIIVPVIILILFFINGSRNETEYIKYYINDYYSQVVDGEIAADQAAKYLSSELLENFEKAGLIPNEKLIEFGKKEKIKNIKIENFKSKKKTISQFDVSYDIFYESSDKKESAHFDETYIIKNGKIEYIGVKAK